MQQDDSKIRELQRLIRDLVALATTPAAWVGRDLPQIADGIADTLLHTVRAEAVYVGLYSGTVTEGLRAAKYPGFKGEAERLRAEAGNASFYVESARLPNWPSQLRMALCPIGLSNGEGFVAVGCSNPTFPSETDSLLLSVAANQGAVAMQTARLRAKAEFERRRLEELLAQAPAAIGLTSGPQHRWAYVNEHYVRVTGRSSASEFIGKTILESLPEIETQPFIGLLDNVFQTGEPYVGRGVRAVLNRAHTGQPEEAFFDFVYQPVKKAAGTVEGILVHAVEVTDAVKAREALETTLVASQRLAAIVESSEDAIVSKNLKGIVSSWNPGAERIFGYSAEEMIGRSIRTIIPPELQDDEDEILAAIGRGDRIEHFETVRLTKSGERIDVALTISPVRDEKGNIIGAAKIARDITHQKQAEQALRTTERLASVGRLAATVAHEINNPLEAVTNLVYLAKDRADRSDVREFLGAIEEELDRISHLTKQTLGFYRETTTPSLLSVGSLIDPLVSVFATRAGNKGVTIQTEIRGDGDIYAVPGEMRQLIANLLSNSIDAVNQGGVVRIRLNTWDGASDERKVRITVADNGPGIPRELRSRLFEPFFTTKREVGTGLGLWVCKNIVERHHGSIRVKSSTRAGRSWTVFSIVLRSLERHAVQETLRQAV